VSVRPAFVDCPEMRAGGYSSLTDQKISAMEDTYQSVITLAVSLAIGLLVGVERSWSSREGEEGSRIAGLSTFSLIGLLGGVAMLPGLLIALM
jgi:uncharacterized membrane protein YhiD involved in acid resistance